MKPLFFKMRQETPMDNTGMIIPPFKMRVETDMERYRWMTWDRKEPETIAWIDSFSGDKSDAFIDVGANVGVYSLYCAHKYPNMSIFAIEPSTYNFESLLINTRENRLYNLYPWQIGISDKIGKMRFKDADCMPGASGGQCGKDGHEISVTTMDALIAWHSKTEGWYVKIDSDGQELAVVRGMVRSLPVVKSALIEVSKTSKAPIVDIMTVAGFTVNNHFNHMSPHSRERREAEGIDAKNIVFMR